MVAPVMAGRGKPPVVALVMVGRDNPPMVAPVLGVAR